MEKKDISKATLSRMPLYLHYLQEANARGEKYVSSTVIAQNIAVSSVLVRKDLELVSSQAGRPRIGFAVSRLIVDIEKFLGYDTLSAAVVVGAGGLGRAFLGYEGFKNNGLDVLAAFDVNKKVIGKKVGDKEILSMDKLETFVEENGVRIGIITVPKQAAQGAVDRLVRAGVKGIWNFAPTPLRVPQGIELKTEDLAASLAILAGKLYNTADNDTPLGD